MTIGGTAPAAVDADAVVLVAKAAVAAGAVVVEDAVAEEEGEAGSNTAASAFSVGALSCTTVPSGFIICKAFLTGLGCASADAGEVGGIATPGGIAGGKLGCPAAGYGGL